MALKDTNIGQSDIQEIMDRVIKANFANDGFLVCNPPLCWEDVMQVLTLAL